MAISLENQENLANRVNLESRASRGNLENPVAVSQVNQVEAIGKIVPFWTQQIMEQQCLIVKNLNARLFVQQELTHLAQQRLNVKKVAGRVNLVIV